VRVLAVACFFLGALDAATLVHQPYLQNMQGDRATIVWSARENAVGTVRYSSDTSFSQSVTAQRVRPYTQAQTNMGITFYQYQADLSGLAPGTTYFYRIFVGPDNVTPVTTDYQFKTAGPGPFTFLVFGDSGDSSSRQIRVTQQMIKEQPDFVLHVGDIAYETGTFDEFTNNYFGFYPTLMRRAPFFAIPGNHEYYSGALPFLALTANPAQTVPPEDAGRYYSFDWQGTHFVGLDANLLDGFHRAEQQRMLDWLENDLANASATWKIAFWHQTPYPIQHHSDLPGVGGDSDPIDVAARRLLNPIVERHGVQLVLTGHEHNYQRTKPLQGSYGDLRSTASFVVPPGQGTVYITSGGGGGVLHGITDQPFLAQKASVNHYLRVRISGPELTVSTIVADAFSGKPDGTIIDQVTLVQAPVLGAGTPVVNAASFQPAIAPGALVSIFGQALALGTDQASGFPLPSTLAGATVTLNGKPIPLVFVSPEQINAALPFNISGDATIRVTTPLGAAETQVTISDIAPAIFTGAIAHATGVLVSAASPAQPGETVIIYMTGLGQVDGPVDVTQPSPSSPLRRVLVPVEVDFGDTNPVKVPADFAGLAPNFVDLYQVNVTIPATLPARIYPLRVMAKGNASNPQNLQVQGKINP
jgi:uncharacterized protein (TIGR03437 family)